MPAESTVDKIHQVDKIKANELSPSNNFRFLVTQQNLRLRQTVKLPSQPSRKEQLSFLSNFVKRDLKEKNITPCKESKAKKFKTQQVCKSLEKLTLNASKSANESGNKQEHMLLINKQISLFNTPLTPSKNWSLNKGKSFVRQSRS